MIVTPLGEQIATASAWLEREAARVAFGEVGITLVMHAGRLVRIERTVREKAPPNAEESHS